MGIFDVFPGMRNDPDFQGFEAGSTKLLCVRKEEAFAKIPKQRDCEKQLTTTQEPSTSSFCTNIKVSKPSQAHGLIIDNPHADAQWQWLLPLPQNRTVSSSWFPKESSSIRKSGIWQVAFSQQHMDNSALDPASWTTQFLLDKHPNNQFLFPHVMANVWVMMSFIVNEGFFTGPWTMDHVFWEPPLLGTAKGHSNSHGQHEMVRFRLRASSAQSSGDSPHVSPPVPKQGRYQSSSADRKLRTAKARTQKLLNTQKRKLEKEHDNQKESQVAMSTGHDTSQSLSFSEHLQHWFFTKSFFHASDQEEAYYFDKHGFERDRARSVFSLIKALASSLGKLFQGSRDADQRIFHVLNVHIVDDTSTRMRGPNLETDRTSIFTIMNTVQSVHIRHALGQEGIREDQSTAENFGCCLSLRVPTPLLILENADAKGIHESFTSCAILTAHGIGRMFQNFGIGKEIVPATCWRTFAFIGDSLKANDAAFRQECVELGKKEDGKHLAIKVKCAVHQICLIRKPAVLMIPRLWTTIVRLSHLFESMTFRKNFARTMAGIVTNSFSYMEVAALPPAALKWASARQRLKDSFRCQSKLRRQAFEDILDFLNGDLESDTVFHFCVNSADHVCCASKEESLSKCLRLLVPFCSRGYQVPLLYRFKHYDEAICYVTFCTTIHQLLARTLLGMDLSKTGDASQRQLIDNLLGEYDLGSEGPGTEAVVFSDNIADENFHAHNAKRKQLVHQEVMSSDFRQSALLVDFMIKPMDSMMNRLFARSHQLTKLCLLQKHDPKWLEDTSKCKDLFLAYASGKFGFSIIDEYADMITKQVHTLLEIGLDIHQGSHLQILFTMWLLVISDAWRRFVHEMATFPWKVFSLLAAKGLKEFVEKWDELKAAKASCTKCFDLEFTSKILDAFPVLAGQPADFQGSVFQEVTILLHDIAVQTPLSSDPVEIKNGQVQVSTTSRRTAGAIKAPAATKEMSFLQSFIRDHALIRHWVEERTLPGKRTIAGIFKRVGVRGTNQDSKHLAVKKVTLDFGRFFCIHHPPSSQFIFINTHTVTKTEQQTDLWKYILLHAGMKGAGGKQKDKDRHTIDTQAEVKC